MKEADYTSVRNGSNTQKLIDLKSSADSLSVGPLISIFRGPIEKALSLSLLNQYYPHYLKRLDQDPGHPEACFQSALKTMNVRIRIDPQDLDRIPQKGPLVVVSNHPFGGIEGVILGKILLETRSDVRILANSLLKHVAGIGDFTIPVDPFEERQTARGNLKGLKDALRWLKNGGVLATFPAGEVASFDIRRRRVIDPPWSSHLGGIVRRAQAAVLPVYFPGKNGWFFQCMGLIHPRLRTALLAREFMNKMNREITVTIGRAIPRQKLKRFENDTDLIHFLRLNTDILRNRRKHPLKRLSNRVIPKPGGRQKLAVIPPVDTGLLETEVRRLPPDQLLVENRELAVYVAGSEQIPNVLTEIGRLREITFREVEEGTGEAVDIDRYDAYYMHLFLWNHERKELVGAYRLGLADQILESHGKRGLYTSTLFRYKPEFVQRLTHAIEFGRSFIRTEYQKKFNSLMLLWKGIGEFVGRHPRYHILFGAVSISKDYHKVSKNLMIRFLKERKSDHSLSRLVTPRKPYRSRRLSGISAQTLTTSIQDLDDVSLLVSEIEKDGKGIPILLRQYLKLNGRLLSFNVDKSFSDVVDGLFMVDLFETGERLMKRFMGAEGYRRFSEVNARALAERQAGRQRKIA